MSGSNFPVNSGPEHKSLQAIRIRHEESQERSALRREALLAHRRRMRHLRMAMFAAAALILICVVVVVMAHT